MGGTGETQVSSGGLLILEGGRKELQRRLVNQGQAEWIAGNIRLSNGTLVNEVAASFEVSFAGNVESNGGVNQFLSQGALRVINDGAVQIQNGVVFDNGGTVSVEAGELKLLGGGSHSGAFDVQQFGTIVFERTAHSFSDGIAFTGTGTVRILVPISLSSDLSLGATQVVIDGNGDLGSGFVVSNEVGGLLSIGRSMRVTGLTIGGRLKLLSADVRLTVDGLLTLNETGAIDNPWAIQASEFVNLGGAIVGNDPLIEEVAQNLLIGKIQIAQESVTELRTLSVSKALLPKLWISWEFKERTQFIVEGSSDFRHWKDQIAEIEERAPGKYWGLIQPSNGSAFSFFRIRAIGPE
jgi:hypothetical protein